MVVMRACSGALHRGVLTRLNHIHDDESAYDVHLYDVNCITMMVIVMMVYVDAIVVMENTVMMMNF